MKKIIAAIVLGACLTSCGGGWSCKKRYCKIDKDKTVKEIYTPASTQYEALVKP